MAEKIKEHKKATLGLSIAIIALITVVVSAATLKFKVDVHAPIVMLAVVIGLIGFFYLKYDYKELEDAAVDSIMAAIPSCMILTLVGMLVGLWMRGGIIPGLIYYGLGILSPKIFPLATVIVCSIISLSTGSSWSTMATVGVAMMGIGNGLGIPPALTAGIVVSGAYFGDKMSPLSDTTNLAPAVSGSSLFDHIRAMCWTTGPSLAIFMVILLFWGMKFSGSSIDSTRIDAIRMMIATEFPVTLWCVVPPILVIGASILKIPAMPGICIGILASVIMCMLDEITGILNTLLDAMTKGVKRAGGLIGATCGACFVANLLTGSQYLSIIIPGRMFKTKFEKSGLAPRMLSRSLEDCGTLTSVLIPWNVCGGYAAAVLGVPTLAYAPYAVLNWITPLFAIAITYVGIGIFWRDENGVDSVQKRTVLNVDN